jgi:hypothetical protein
MAAHGVRPETVRAADHDIATGVWPDMTEHGADGIQARATGIAATTGRGRFTAGPRVFAAVIRR